MPYEVVKGGGKCGDSQWAVLNKSTGKSMGCHPTKASANKQLAALAIHVTTKESAEEATMPKPLHETTPLSEAGIGTAKSGRMKVRAISAGVGSSGYYSPQVLERAAVDGLIREGTHLYLDHPTDGEATDRPERSVKDIAAVFTGPAAYDANAQALVGEIRVMAPYRDLLEDLAPHIGLSIRGSATDVTEGEVDGQRVRVIEGLHSIDSVDFVTRAGRGGRILQVLESAIAEAHEQAEAAPPDVPATRPDSTTTTEADQEVTMGKIQVEESEHSRLVEQAGRVDTLSAERDTEKARADAAEQKLAEAAAAAAKDGTPAPPAGPPTNPRQVIETRLAAQEAEIAQMRARERGRDIINEELAEAWVAPTTVARLATDLIGRLPLVEGKLDEPGLRTLCVEARDRAELEAAETLNAAGVGTPRGLGAITTPAGGDADRYTQDIAESLQGAFGLSENEAASAVKGR